MSNEITVNLSGRVAIGTSPYDMTGEAFPPQSGGFDASVSLLDAGTLVLTTGDTNLTALFPNTATIDGVLFIKNLDPTNYVQIGPTVAGAIAPLSRLNPGKWLYVPLEPGLTLRGKAHTASCKI